MKKHGKVANAFVFAMAVLMVVSAFTSCQNPSAQTLSGTAKSITVVVADAMPKAITPSGTVNVSHYKITVSKGRVLHGLQCPGRHVEGNSRCIRQEWLCRN